MRCKVCSIEIEGFCELFVKDNFICHANCKNENVIPCDKCKGRGVVYKQVKHILATYPDGSEKAIYEKVDEKCSKCNGKGYLTKEEKDIFNQKIKEEILQKEKELELLKQRII